MACNGRGSSVRTSLSSGLGALSRVDFHGCGCGILRVVVRMSQGGLARYPVLAVGMLSGRSSRVGPLPGQTPGDLLSLDDFRCEVER